MSAADYLSIWCPCCRAVVDYECLCEDGEPQWPLVTKVEIDARVMPEPGTQSADTAEPRPC